MDTSMSLSLFTTIVMQKLQIKLGERFTVLSSNIRKNNGVELSGIVIREKDCNTHPTIYINDFYEEYKRGASVEAIAENLRDIFKRNRLVKSVDLSTFTDYEKAKKQIAFKIINYEKNRELLKEVPHKVIYNLAIVFYYMVKEVPFEGKATILINDSHLKNWKISEEELYQNAMINTPIMLPARIENIENVMMNLLESGVCEDAEDLLCHFGEAEKGSDKIPMYVLSNKKNIFGAACMIYPGVLKNFAYKKQTNFYVLPSSVHEVILLPETNIMDKDSLLEMVTEINRTQVEETEVLADSVYFYDRIGDKLARLC